jgi:hypothetical protein
MLHLFPQTTLDSRPAAYAEAVSRLASVRHALTLVGELGDGPSGDRSDAEIALAWDDAGAAKQRWFDRSSARLVEATAAGCEALLNERQSGRVPHPAASEALVNEIRRELRDVAGIVLA